MNTLLRKALHAEVNLLRMPLQVLDDRVVSRYTAPESRVRQTVRTALSVVDQAADLLADHPATTEQADDTDQFGSTATQPARPAARPRQSAPTEAPVPGEPLPEPEREEVEELAEELLDEQEEETFAGELADDDELRRLQAELQAKHIVEETTEQELDTNNGA